MIEFVKSFTYAFKGIFTALQGQRNIKIQLVIAAVVIGASAYYSISAAEWCIVLLVIAMVLTLEMMNTALEHTVNLVTKDYHPLAKKAKDVAAGAVLVASILATVIGYIIFSKYIDIF